MNTIYICEDNEQQLQLIKSYVEDFLTFHKEKLTPKIAAYTTPQELLDDVQSKDNIGCYLLDVDFGNQQNGIHLAEAIRKYDPKGFIIFITTHDELMPLTFKHRVEAFDYISKNDDDLRSRILQTLERVYERYDSFQKKKTPAMPIKVQIKAGSTLHYINGYDIVCATMLKDQHRVKLYTSAGTIEYYGSLKSLKKELPLDQFYQCHRSALMNIACLSSIDTNKNVAQMCNGISIPISTRKLEELKKYFSSILK